MIEIFIQDLSGDISACIRAFSETIYPRKGRYSKLVAEEDNSLLR